MSADTLRQAATAMRTRAEAASPSPWRPFDQHGRDYTDEGWSQIGVTNDGHDIALTHPTGFENDYPEPDAEHIASWHPAVALAVADLLDEYAHLWETSETPDTDMWLAPIGRHLLTVATAYLGATT